MRGVLLATALVALALGSLAVDADADASLGDTMVDPLTGELGEDADPMRNLQQNVDAATSVEQVKLGMSNSIKAAMADKKAELLTKASKLADEKTEEAAEAKAEKEAQIDIENQENKAEMRGKERKADEDAASAKAEQASAEVDAAKSELSRVEEGKSLVFQRSAAEEKAKTATADRIAAEEKAKTSAAQRVASEEDARKAAALRLTQEEQARAAQKSPMELHAMEAKAFQEAAALKVKEGEALARVAALKSGNDLMHTKDQDIAKEANAKTSLHDAKIKLHHLVEQATAALFQAKAKPFDKAALKQVISIKDAVSRAKADVVRLAATLKADEKSVTSISSEIDEKKNEDEQHEDPHHNEGNEESMPEEKDPKYDLKHPDLEHMTDDQVKYWANKKMKWRVEDPMDKNKVMSKIFMIKNMESQTLTKMNELNTQIGMNTTGMRAGMLGKGETVIMDGELIKPDPGVHVNHVFQGQKGRDPKTEENGRDAETDELKVSTEADIHDDISAFHDQSMSDIDQAIAARTPPFTPRGGMRAPVNTLADLKKAVSTNQEKGLGPDKSDEEEAEVDEKMEEQQPDKQAAEPKLGDADDADDEDDSVQSLEEREDDDAMSDDNDVSEVEDETSMEDDDLSGDDSFGTK